MIRIDRDKIWGTKFDWSLCLVKLNAKEQGKGDKSRKEQRE